MAAYDKLQFELDKFVSFFQILLGNFGSNDKELKKGEQLHRILTSVVSSDLCYTAKLAALLNTVFHIEESNYYWTHRLVDMKSMAKSVDNSLFRTSSGCPKNEFANPFQDLALWESESILFKDPFSIFDVWLALNEPACKFLKDYEETLLTTQLEPSFLTRCQFFNGSSENLNNFAIFLINLNGAFRNILTLRDTSRKWSEEQKMQIPAEPGFAAFRTAFDVFELKNFSVDTPERVFGSQSFTTPVVLDHLDQLLKFSKTPVASDRVQPIRIVEDYWRLFGTFPYPSWHLEVWNEDEEGVDDVEEADVEIFFQQLFQDVFFQHLFPVQEVHIPQLYFEDEGFVDGGADLSDVD